MLAERSKAASDTLKMARPGGSAKAFELDRHNGETRNGIGDEENVVVFIHHGRDFGEWVHDAGGGFVVDEGHGVEFTGGEFFIDIAGIDRRAPVILEGFGVFSAATSDIDPLVGEST